MNFDLWIETEHLEGPVKDFCNVLVTLQTGEEYALNVWTFAFFETARAQREETASPDVAARYLLPPDLFVVSCPGRRWNRSSKTCSSAARCQPTV